MDDNQAFDDGKEPMADSQSVSSVVPSASVEPKLINILKKFSLTNEQVAHLVAFLVPSVEGYARNVIKDNFTQIELDTFEKAASDNSLNDEQRQAMLEEAFKEKTGKDMGEVIDIFFDQIADAIESGLNQTQEILDKVKDLPEDQKEAEVSKLLNQIVQIQINKPLLFTKL